MHAERALVQLTILCPSFEIKGIEVRKHGAARYVLFNTLKSALDNKILNFANRLGFWPKALLTSSAIAEYLHVADSKITAPDAFKLLKWKTTETLRDWRWRLLISHKGHSLKRTSQQVGRCLSVLLRKLHIAFSFWGTPSMTGVKDAHSYIKTHAPRVLDLWERDIDNAYWELDKGAVLEAVRQAARIVRTHRNVRGGFWFSIAKGGLKSLDRVGKASDKGFRTIHLDEVVSFVNWDMHFNNLLCLWGVILKQQKKGIPIGGLLSAQLMCLWALICEYNSLESDDKQALLQPVLSPWPDALPQPVIKPGPVLTFPFVAYVPTSRDMFDDQGMHGWFRPESKLLFTLQLPAIAIPVVAMGLWDSHPEGRVGKIIDRSVRSQRKFLLSYFHDFNPLRCMLRETEVQHAVSDLPTILLTRYMDNSYVALLNVPHQLHDAVRLFVSRFPSAVYDIPMKWEPEGTTVSWCEASLTTAGTLVLKGVPTTPDESALPLWHRWPDRWFPSCPVTLQSMIPSLVLKAVILCSDPIARKLNFHTII